jgi:hypothetical protein
MPDKFLRTSHEQINTFRADAHQPLKPIAKSMMPTHVWEKCGP